MIRFRSVGGPIVGQRVFVSARHNAFDVGDVSSCGRTVLKVADFGDLRFHLVDRSFERWTPMTDEVPTDEVFVSGMGKTATLIGDGLYDIDPDPEPTQRTGRTRVYMSSFGMAATVFEPDGLQCVIHDSGGGMYVNEYGELHLAGIVVSSTSTRQRASYGDTSWFILVGDWISRTKTLRSKGDLDLDGRVTKADLNLAVKRRKFTELLSVLGNL